MADEQKIYVPKCSAKQITFASGKTIIKLGIHADTMIAFLKANQNAKGYVNLGISYRKETGQYGDTHSVWLDTWQPDKVTERTQPATVAPKAAPQPDKGDDVPF